MPGPYDPTPDDPNPPPQPQLGALVSGQQTPTQPTPPATPEDHAQLKQSWMDWFHNPAVAGFLLQASASMLSNAGQPGMSLGRVVGQGIGEGGEAVARQSQQELEQEKQATEEQKATSEGQRAAAEADYYKQTGPARMLEAQAAWKNALNNADKLPLEEQRIMLQSALGEARLGVAASGVDIARQRLQIDQMTADFNNKLKDIEAKQKAAQTEVIISPQKRFALDSYYKAVTASEQLGTDPPDPKKYNLTPEDLGVAPAPAPTAASTAPATTAPATTAPPPKAGQSAMDVIRANQAPATPVVPAPAATVPDLSAVPQDKWNEAFAADAATANKALADQVANGKISAEQAQKIRAGATAKAPQ